VDQTGNKEIIGTMESSLIQIVVHLLDNYGILDYLSQLAAPIWIGPTIIDHGLKAPYESFERVSAARVVENPPLQLCYSRSYLSPCVLPHAS
jgi:hypothetical protein